MHVHMHIQHTLYQAAYIVTHARNQNFFSQGEGGPRDIKICQRRGIQGIFSVFFLNKFKKFEFLGGFGPPPPISPPYEYAHGGQFSSLTISA